MTHAHTQTMAEPAAMSPKISAALETLPAVKHGFFTRQGGYGFGLYDSLNCSPFAHDDPEIVHANRERVAEYLGTGAENLITLKQVHGVGVVPVKATDTFQVVTQQDGDALVTRESHIAIGVLTADCAPVLLADAEARVIGAVHAGWKGAVAGVVEATVRAMVGLGAEAERIVASVGPCIAQDSYEVDTAFEMAFDDAGHDTRRWFRPSDVPTKSFFDLSGFVQSRLMASGVRQFDAVDADTYTQESLFFSYRRCCHRGKHDFGRQISAIMLDYS